MLKRWSGSGFPLALIVTLAALTAWLKNAVDLPEPSSDGKRRHDPDYVIEGARVTRLDDSGRMLYTLQVERMVHYPDNDSTEATQPRLVYLNPGREPTTLSARRGSVSTGGEEVVLSDKVEVQRPATRQRAALLARTERLTIRPDDERATTDLPVHISQGRSWISGTGMELDNAAQTFVLKSRVTGQFEPNRSR